MTIEDDIQALKLEAARTELMAAELRLMTAKQEFLTMKSKCSEHSLPDFDVYFARQSAANRKEGILP